MVFDMPTNDPTLDFDRHYALIRSQQPVKPHGLTRQMAETLMEVLDPGRMESFIVKLALANDVESLKRFSNTNLIDEVMERTQRSQAVMFAPAHMLIDNSGNEGFARHWLERCKFTQALAADYYQKNSRLELNDTIHEQQRLGVATLTNIFALAQTFHLPERDGVLTSPFKAVMERAGGVNMAQQSRELAFILRTCHPDQLPTLEYMDDNGVHDVAPLSDRVWGMQGLRFRHLLDGLSEAYSPDNAAVLATMRSSIDRMMDQKLLSIEPPRNSGGIEGYQWKALGIWASEGYGAKIWSSRMVPDTSCIEMLVQATGEELDARMKQLIRMGADINEPTSTRAQGEDVKLRLMELAVSKAKPEVVAWLLAHGADPDLPMQPVEGIPSRSAAQMAVDMTTDIQSTTQGPDIERVATLMRAHLAKQSALGVIAELDESHGMSASQP